MKILQKEIRSCLEKWELAEAKFRAMKFTQSFKLVLFGAE